MRNLSLSIIILSVYIIYVATLYLIPINSLMDYFREHPSAISISFFIIQYTPIFIGIISITELFVKKRKVLSIVSLSLSIIIFCLFKILFTNSFTPEDFDIIEIGKVDFSTQKTTNSTVSSCDYSFNVSLVIESEDDLLKNEIILKQSNLNQTIKELAKKHCLESSLEGYINQNCLEQINSMLDNGEIERIEFGNLSSKSSWNVK